MTLLEQIQSLDPALVSSRDDAAIAAALSVGRVKVQPKIGGIGLVLETLGPDNGAELLDSLQVMSATIPALKWAWYLIERGELDFGSPATRGMIDVLVDNGAINESVGAALKAVAEVPDPVSVYDVQVALYNDDGTSKL